LSSSSLEGGREGRKEGRGAGGMGVAASMAGAEGGEGDSATRRLSRFRRRSSASRVNDPTGEAHEQGSATPFPLSAELTARDTQLLQALDFHRASYVILEMGSSDSIVFASTGFSEKTGISAENAVGKAAVDLALSTLQVSGRRERPSLRHWTYFLVLTLILCRRSHQSKWRI
jgi:hypothetical protein